MRNTKCDAYILAAVDSIIIILIFPSASVTSSVQLITINNWPWPRALFLSLSLRQAGNKNRTNNKYGFSVEMTVRRMMISNDGKLSFLLQKYFFLSSSIFIVDQRQRYVISTGRFIRLENETNKLKKKSRPTSNGFLYCNFCSLKY